MCVTRKMLFLVAAAAVVLFAAAPAIADWDVGDPAKWVQLPDITPEGIDVKVTRPKILADDWECRDPRPVTDVHIWGSWKYDEQPTMAEPMMCLGSA